MSDNGISEVLGLISTRSSQEIRSMLQAAFSKPAPKVSPMLLNKVANQIQSPESLKQARMAALYMAMLTSDPSVPHPSLGWEYELLRTDPETGMKFWRGVPIKWDTTETEAKKLSPEAERILAGVKKLGDGKTANDQIKRSLMRHAARKSVDGVWQSVVLTSAFEYRLLLDGEFMGYMVRIGVSGLYGGTVGGLSQLIGNRFFGNSAVIGVLVGSVFGIVNLQSTGDWERFGKDTGVNITGTAGGYAGGIVGTAIGSFGGPIGAAVGGLIGALSAGHAGRKLALKIPFLRDATAQEVKVAYEAIKKQLFDAGLQHDPSLSPEEVVTAFAENGQRKGLPFKVRMTDSEAMNMKEIYDELQAFQNSSPDEFAAFAELLRGTAEVSRFVHVTHVGTDDGDATSKVTGL